MGPLPSYKRNHVTQPGFNREESATATDPAGNTSEFSEDVAVQ
jgi:hypothetical protein